jgi:NAD+ synthase
MMPVDEAVTPEALRLDPELATTTIVAGLQETVQRRLRRRGAVVALSGGVDSSVVLALCLRAFGRNSTLALLLPESESSNDTRRLSSLVVDALEAEAVVEDITPLLDAAGCYQRRDAAIRSVLPEYGEGWRAKIVLPTILGTGRMRVFSVVAESPDSRLHEERLTVEAYREVVAATSFKQRVRKMLEYYHADRRHFAVVGTPNRLEYDLGFFVKNGDGAADVKPIAHLYKTQVYQLAEYLGLPDEVHAAEPTTDTYALPQTQQEFYFSLPYQTLDLCLYAHNHELPAAAVTDATGLSPADVERVFGDIDQKRRATAYLHLPAQLIEPLEAQS